MSELSLFNTFRGLGAYGGISVVVSTATCEVASKGANPLYHPKIMKNKLQYCPICGEKAELKKEEKSVYLSCENDHIYYINPNPTVSALIYKDSKILLSKRAIEPAKGKWDLINGYMELDETPLEGIEREVKEELGVEFEVEDLLGFNVSDYYAIEPGKNMNIYFCGSVSAEKLKLSDELKEVKWFDFNDIPYDEIGFDHHIGIIKELVEFSDGCATCEFREQCKDSE